MLATVFFFFLLFGWSKSVLGDGKVEASSAVLT